MKIWKSLLVLTGATILAAGGFWIYQKWIAPKTTDGLRLISTDAVFTFESYQADQLWNELVQHPSWEIVSQFPAFQDISDKLTFLDSITGQTGEVSKMLRGKQLTVSYHPTGRESFELLFGLEVDHEDSDSFLTKFQNKLGSNFKLNSRSYSDQQIWEFQHTSRQSSWSVTRLGQILLLSPSSFLIEQSIRLFLSEEGNTLAQLLGNAASYRGDGRLILTSTGVANFLSGVSLNRESSQIAALLARRDWLSLELSLLEDQIEFRGHTSLDSVTSFLPSVQANFPAFEKILSNRTQSLLQINLSDIFLAQKLQNQAFSPKSTLQGEIQNKLIDRGFLDSFTGEFYLARLESFGNQKDNLVLLSRSTYPEQTWASLKEFRNTTENSSSDFYMGNEILFFPEEDFPAHLFEGKFLGFPQTHLCMIGEILIMTNSAPGMKVLLDDIASQNTWPQNSSAYSAAIHPAAGLSQTIFPSKIWNYWITESNPSWSTFLQKYRSAFLAFPYLSLRFNQYGDNTEATIILPFQKGSAAVKEKPDALVLSPNQVINLSQEVSFGPFPVRNFNDRTQDLVTQTSDHRLLLHDSSGEQVYEVQLDGPVVSEPFQLDYYKNGKLQLLVATANFIYGIDRLGNSLPGFPIKLPNDQITHLNLVDYDQTRDYRIFVASEKGNLWLLDKNGSILEGWNPNPLGNRALSFPTHIRVPGKGDYMTVQTQNGNYHLFNRRGEKQAGSPLDFKAEVNTPAKITSDGAGSLKITAISIGGELIRGNFSGEIAYRNQLVKENRDDRFELLADEKGASYWIVNRQFNQTKIFDEKEQLLFIIPQSGNLNLEFFDFGSDRKILAVTDREQGFGFLYDGKGTMLTATPLESEGKISILHQASTGQYLIHTRSGNRILEYLMPD